MSPSKVERRLRRLDPVAAEAGVALDQESHVGAVTRARLGQFARDHLVVEHDGQPAQPCRERHEPIGLGPAEDVERQ